jgi:carboxyl-terminal processing protease
VPDTNFQSSLSMVTGTINQNIIYFHFNTFYVQLVHDSTYIYSTWNRFLYYLDAPPKGLRGLILDLRSNNGGAISDLTYIAGRLINKEIDFGYTRQKSGDGRLDYTSWVPAHFEPYYTENQAFTRPIVILTDQNSISMAELTTMALKMLPNTHVIGDTTWGATGPLNSGLADYNGGQFVFDNFGFVRTSIVQFKYHNGMIYEGKGFPPDEYVPYSRDSLLAGNDVQLSAAVNFINENY